MYDHVVIEAHEHYQKGGYRNRAHILGSNGIERLSIPLRSGKHQQKPIREVEIAYDEPWGKVHWRAIQTVYSAAPFFEHYAEQLKSILESKPRFLFDLNMEIMQFLCENMHLRKASLTSGYERIALSSQDLRNTITPKTQDDDINFKVQTYFQTFDDRQPFSGNLSCIDLLFALGPEAKALLRRSVVHTC